MDHPNSDPDTESQQGTAAADPVTRATLPADAGRPIPPAPSRVPPIDPAAVSAYRRNSGLGAPPPSRSDQTGRTHPHWAPPVIDRVPLSPPQQTRRPAQLGIGALILGFFGAGVVGAVVTVAALFGSGALDAAETQVIAPDPPPPEIITVTEIVTPEATTTSAAAVARKVVPSIVTVEVGSLDETDGFFDVVASGSGVVLSADGELVTNHHVIEGADQVRVVFQDGRIHTAEIVGSDELTDLAVLVIEAGNLTPVEIGTTDGLSIGDVAIAVGNPLGLAGGASLTVGVVSAFNREVIVGPDQSDQLHGMLQTDAPITRGSSGGALVDGEGRLIGITTAIGVSDAGAEGIGFAIPVELVIRITSEILEVGDVRHAFLGVQLRDFFSEDGKVLTPAGAAVFSVEPETSAEAFGLEPGDLIVRLDAMEVRASQDVVIALRRYRVGEIVGLEILRNGETLTIDVTLGERPDDL